MSRKNVNSQAVSNKANKTNEAGNQKDQKGTQDLQKLQAELQAESNAQAIKKPADAKDKKPGVIATIVDMVKNGNEGKGVSKQDILERLKKAFPDRSVTSMKNTVSVQVPHRINKERFPVAKTYQPDGTLLYFEDKADK